MADRIAGPFDELVPSETVKKLDEFIIGQEEAKRTIAVALRNRVRRRKLPKEIRDEISPKNIMMIGPTGVGKTEIARRMAKIANAPFVKVEATKYTEVGYVGRDVESMIRDLVSASISLVREELAGQRKTEIEQRVEQKLAELVLAKFKQEGRDFSEDRDELINKLRKGLLDDVEVELRVEPRREAAAFGIGANGNASPEDMQNALDRISGILSGKVNRKRIASVKRARKILADEETDKLIDPEKVTGEAVERAEEMGIIFIDEIDKIASSSIGSSSADVAREGVQRDILPIVEGSKVHTKWGVVDTTNILFIAAGAFSASKPSDLMPELQGRFPLRVELHDLTSDEFFRILKEPKNAMTKQYSALMSTENVKLTFTDGALKEISEIAYDLNRTTDNIGARRLYTVMEKLLEELSFSADQLSGQSIEITEDYVDRMLSDAVEKRDLTRYIF